MKNKVKKRGFFMNGILILAHGSKRPETEKILNSLVEKVKSKVEEQLVLPAYLQFQEQNLEKGIDMLVEKGAKRIVIIPMFIFDGVHVTEDIPKELDDIRIKYPEIEISMGGHIGDDEKLADILIDRIKSVV
jgi:sirohydrochlorin ferrochelatase